MAIELECPRCRTSMRLADEQAGQKVACPGCAARLRVPVPETMPPAGSSAAVPSAGEIEFHCPRCESALRVPASAAGQKLLCPRCSAKLQVPWPEAAPVTTPRIPVSLPPAPTVSTAPVPDEIVVPDEEEPAAPEIVRSLKGYNWLAFAVPLVCVGLLIGLAVFLTRKPEPKFEGELTGDPITDVELGSFLIDPDFYGAPVGTLKPTLEHLEGEPLPAESSLLEMQFRANPRGLFVRIAAQADTQFYRVDPRQEKLLAKFCNENRGRFDAFRRSNLSRVVPEFLHELEQRSQGEPDIKRLPEFRNTVGLASLVGGIGYRVQAVFKEEVYPCVLEDTENRWYFILPRDVRTFEIVPRPAPAGSTASVPEFPGHYRVTVSHAPVTIRRESAPKKTGRELLGFGPKSGDDEPAPEPEPAAGPAKKRRKKSP